MAPRLTSAMRVSALVRRVGQEGGNAAIIARGDADAGAILLMLMEKGQARGLREQLLDSAGRYVFSAIGPSESPLYDDYLARRRARDPDIWIVELDIANAERFAAEMDKAG